MAARRYITNSILESALQAKTTNALPLDIQLSPLVFVTFGTSGVSLCKYLTKGNRARMLKWANNWATMTANEINKVFAEQEWEVRE